MRFATPTLFLILLDTCLGASDKSPHPHQGVIKVNCKRDHLAFNDVVTDTVVNSPEFPPHSPFSSGSQT